MKFERDRKWLFNRGVKEHIQRSFENHKIELEEAKKKLLSVKDDKEREALETRIAFLEHNLKEKKRQKFTNTFQNWAISIIAILVMIAVILVIVFVVVI